MVPMLSANSSRSASTQCASAVRGSLSNWPACGRLQGLRESPNSEGLQLSPARVTLRVIYVVAAITMCQITGSGLHATQNDLISIRQAAKVGDADAQNQTSSHRSI